MLMVVVVIGLAGLAAVTALCLCLLHLGPRAGDRPGDAAAAATLGGAGQPGERGPVVIVIVRNPGDAPLMAGFTAIARRGPAWYGGWPRVQVPRRTTRRRLLAAAHEVVGVVPAAGDAEFAVPVPAVSRRYAVTAVIGQRAGRLRVLRVPVQDRYTGGPSAVIQALDGGRLT